MENSSSSTHQTVAKMFLFYVRLEVFTAVIMKIVVFWDIKTQFVPHKPLCYRVQPVNAM
jgi:hypothetical protein